MPSFSAHSLLVSTATLFRISRVFASYTRLGLSRMPVRLTPRSLSSSQFRFQIFRRYPKSVKVLWIVPRIAAILTFLLRSARLSLHLTTTSVRFSCIKQGALLPCQRFLIPFLHIPMQLRLYHHHSIKNELGASTHLSVLPFGIVVERSSFEASLLIVCPRVPSNSPSFTSAI